MATMLKAENLENRGAVGHGFFTREGGASLAPYRGLNCGYGSGDDPEAVSENRRRALHMLGLGGTALVTAYQVHSADAVVVTEPWTPDAAPKADAMVTDRPGIALGILTADCAPVLFADAGAGVVGAAHAGWRGAQAGVLEACVAAMQDMGATLGAISAAVGPCIGQASYEVGPEFHGEFLSDDSGNETFFVPSVRDDHYLFDLPGYVQSRLAGLGLASVEGLDADTLADEGRFFSYRRATLAGKTEYGRLLSAITIKE